MKKHHKVLIGGVSSAVVISMIIFGIILNGLIIKQTIENNQLKQEIKSLDKKVEELTIDAINTKYSLNTNIENINENLDSVNKKIDQDFSEVIEKSLTSIVTLRTLYSQGTGFLINSQGYIVTNAHVLTNEKGEFSNLIQVITNDQKIITGNFVGAINEMDLAIIKVDGEYDYLTLEKSENIQTGQKVIAIGNPQSLQFSATDGIISAINRPGANEYSTYIQTNTELNPGNSGGPLINQEGRVVGMNNFKLIESEGLGFALEADKVKYGVNEIGQKLLNQTLIV